MTFKYKVMNIEGRELCGKLVAANEQAALDKLKAKGLFPLKLKKIVDTDQPKIEAEFEQLPDFAPEAIENMPDDSMPMVGIDLDGLMFEDDEIPQGVLNETDSNRSTPITINILYENECEDIFFIFTPSETSNDMPEMKMPVEAIHNLYTRGIFCWKKMYFEYNNRNYWLRSSAVSELRFEWEYAKEASEEGSGGT
ncbi:MAG: hypothetical protein L3J71_15565 [Victivallaceae bacterium]|nr:hypothetical protein [Victivallaceae bacterium]